jgi:hypothetical protein
MAKTATCPHVQNINNVDGAILPADTTTKKTVWTAGANDGVLKSLGLSSTDTSNRNVQIWVNIGGAGTDRLMGTVVVIANAGNDGVTQVTDVMHSTLQQFLSFDAAGNRVFYAKAGTTIKIASTTTVTAAKEIDAVGDGGDF